jgi:hypothetical protein
VLFFAPSGRGQCPGDAAILIPPVARKRGYNEEEIFISPKLKTNSLPIFSEGSSDTRTKKFFPKAGVKNYFLKCLIINNLR